MIITAVGIAGLLIVGFLCGLVVDSIVSAVINRYNRPVAIHRARFWVGYALRFGFLAALLFMPPDMFGENITVLDNFPWFFRMCITAGCPPVKGEGLAVLVGFWLIVVYVALPWVIWSTVFDTIRLTRIASALYARRVEHLRW